ncbi:hypothetical protein [Brevundimonas subvibrioides]|uniref:hypothetical protein n=1 Tax=Brevundimonas subvibrioides TaxID=74313 RepID=UPI0032D5778D
MHGPRAVVLTEVFARQQQADIRGEVEVQLCADHAAVQVVDVGTRHRIGSEAVALFGLAGDAELDAVGDRAADGDLADQGVVVAEGQAAVAFHDIRRLGADDVDRAADGVPAVQSTLRTPQDLDARDIKQRRQLRLGAGHIGPVDVQRHAG